LDGNIATDRMGKQAYSPESAGLLTLLNRVLDRSMVISPETAVLAIA